MEQIAREKVQPARVNEESSRRREESAAKAEAIVNNFREEGTGEEDEDGEQGRVHPVLISSISPSGRRAEVESMWKTDIQDAKHDQASHPKLLRLEDGPRKEASIISMSPKSNEDPLACLEDDEAAALLKKLLKVKKSRKRKQRRKQKAKKEEQGYLTEQPTKEEAEKEVASKEDRIAEDVMNPEPNEDPLACLEDEEPGVPLHFVFVVKDDAQGRAHPVLVSEEDCTAEDGMSPKPNEDPLACLEDDEAAVPLHFVFVAEDDPQGRAHPVLVSSILSLSQGTEEGSRHTADVSGSLDPVEAVSDVGGRKDVRSWSRKASCMVEVKGVGAGNATTTGEGREESKSSSDSHEEDWILVTSRRKVKKKEEVKKMRRCKACTTKPPIQPSPMKTTTSLKHLMKLMNQSVPGSEEQSPARTKRHCPSVAPPRSFMPLHQLVSAPFVHKRMPRRVRPDRRVKYYPAGTSRYSTRRATGAP